MGTRLMVGLGQSLAGLRLAKSLTTLGAPPTQGGGVSPVDPDLLYAFTFNGEPFTFGGVAFTYGAP